MSRICPLTDDIVLYLECNECEDKKACRQGLLRPTIDEDMSNKEDAIPS